MWINRFCAAYIVLLGVAIRSVNAVTCYYDCTASLSAACAAYRDVGPTCTGKSCARATGKYLGITLTLRYCWDESYLDDCRDSLVSGLQSKACFCTTSYCNGRTKPDQIGQTTTTTAISTWRGPTVVCYHDCSSTLAGACSMYQNTEPTCTGKSCVHATGNYLGETATLRYCWYDSYLDRCSDTTVGIMDVRACFCTTSYCNARANDHAIGSTTPKNDEDLTTSSTNKPALNALSVIFALAVTVSRLTI